MLLCLALCLFQERTWAPARLLCQLQDLRINESSGVGESTTTGGVYYTHNDSGDTARFFRFTKSGVTGVFDLVGAQAVDWEDMASVKFGGKSWLYFGDIGDNKSVRQNVTVYRLEEPTGASRGLTAYDSYTLTYPDGPHNCETLIVDPGSGDICLVTKSDTASGVFFLPRPSGSGTFRLTRLGEITPDTGGGKYGRRVTAGDADPAGRHVILRTYTGALEYTVNGTFRDWWKGTPKFVPMPLDPQGEGIAYTHGGRGLNTTSEGSPCPVHELLLQPAKK